MTPMDFSEKGTAVDCGICTYDWKKQTMDSRTSKFGTFNNTSYGTQRPGACGTPIIDTNWDSSQD